jgi:hypothetical protein
MISYWIGISACCAIAGYGDEKKALFQSIRNGPSEASEDVLMANSNDQVQLTLELDDIRTSQAIALANRTHDVILRRFGDPKVLPYIHVTFVFLHYLTYIPEVMHVVGEEFPWEVTALFLNDLLASYETFDHIQGDHFPDDFEKGDSRRPLPEDYAMRGLLWTEKYYPDNHFSGEEKDDDEKYMELPSMVEKRKQRVLYLGCRIAVRSVKWFRYDQSTHKFAAVPQLEVELDLSRPQHYEEMVKPPELLDIGRTLQLSLD